MACLSVVGPDATAVVPKHDELTVLPLSVGVAVQNDAGEPEPTTVVLLQQALTPLLAAQWLLDNESMVEVHERLKDRIKRTAEEALGTLGYFSAEVLVAPPDAGRDARQVADIAVKLGQKAVVRKVDVQFMGAIASDDFAAFRERLTSEWELQPETHFSQADWQRSKDKLLTLLMSEYFASAQIEYSQALVANEGAGHVRVVDLTIRYDSGPAYRLGPLQVQGLQRYRPDLIARMSNLLEGEPYRQERLLQLQSSLQQSVYFASADVRLMLDSIPAEMQVSSMDAQQHEALTVPVLVKVTESDRHRLSFGAGYSSNTGFRTEGTYQFHNLFERAYALSSGLRLEQRRQSAFVDLTRPPSPSGTMDAIGIALDHQRLDSLDVERSAVGLVRRFNATERDVNWGKLALGVYYQLEDRFSQGRLLGNSNALVFSADLQHRNVNDPLNPKRGYTVDTRLAGASQALGSQQNFIHAKSALNHYWPLSTSKTLLGRIELGTVLAGPARNIPQNYLFRAGGTQSVRGFGYLDLGILEQGVVQGGRHVLTGGLDVIQRLKGPWSAAVFVDVGGVADTWAQLEIKTAVGMGVRYQTPAGPIVLDVAKGFGEPRPRLHFALGVAF